MDVATAPPEAPVETRPLEPRPKTPREVGEHAARYIEEHGWWHTDSTAGGGTVCAYQALNHAGDDDECGTATVALAQALGWAGQDWDDETAQVVFNWNDAPERTEAEVLAALRSIR